MSITIELPRAYGYVVATTAVTFFLGFFHGMRAGMGRGETGLKCPKAFADSGDMANARDKEHAKTLYLFNCKQRAHANYSELQPSTAIAMLIAGVVYPLTTTLLGVGWIIGRIIYAIGYTRPDKEDGKGRFMGFFISQPLAMGLWGLAGWVGIRMVL